MRILAGIVIALALVTAAIVYTGMMAGDLPPSPLAALEPPDAPVSDESASDEQVAGEPSAEPILAPEPDKSRFEAADPSPDQNAPPAAPTSQPDVDPALEPVRRDIRDVTPDHVLPAPRLDEELIERLPAVAPPAVPPRPPKPERWRRAQVLAPGIFRSGDRRIVLAGIEPLAGDAVCQTEKGEDWPCGNYATASLRRLVRQRPIDCDSVETPDDNGSIVTRCRIAGRDIGAWLVDRGWARPGEGGDYQEAFDAARAAGRGQFRKALGRKPLTSTLPKAPLETGTTSLLAPGITAVEALVPLNDPDSAAPVQQDAPPEALPGETAGRGGLDQ